MWQANCRISERKERLKKEKKKKTINKKLNKANLSASAKIKYVRAQRKEMRVNGKRVVAAGSSS